MSHEDSAVTDRRYNSIGHWGWLVSALQDCVMQIGWMHFARIECDDNALVREIDFDILHPRNVFQHWSQFAHALITIFAFGGDLDRFQNGVVRP